MGTATGMAQPLRRTSVGPSPSEKSERHLHLVHDAAGAVADELHHLREIEEKGDSPATALLVVAQVLATILVAVSIELTIAYAFYFGWL